MHKLIAIAVFFLASSIQAATVVIDFEEFPTGPVNRPSGDATSKGFALDYFQGQFGPVAAQTGRGTGRGYLLCPRCQPIERLDIYELNGRQFGLESLDVAASSDGGSYDFIVTGFQLGGGIVTQSALNVTVLQTMTFDSDWSELDSFRIEIDTANSNNSFSSAIDNIRLNVVPIPAAFWLFASALIGIGSFRQRTSSAKSFGV